MDWLSLTQVFGQQDSSVSNPSSGSQILQPCPFPLNPLPWPRANRTPPGVVPDIWSPGLGMASEPRTTRAEAWKRSHHGLLNLSCPLVGCQSDLWEMPGGRAGGEHVSGHGHPLLSSRHPPQIQQKGRASLPCDLRQIPSLLWASAAFEMGLKVPQIASCQEDQ